MTEGIAGFPEVLRARDFMGWDIVDNGGEKIGAVSDILLDREGKLRFLDLEFGGISKKHVLIPMNQLEWGDRKFVLGGWSRDEVRNLPPFTSDQIVDQQRLTDLERSYPWMYGAQSEDWRVPAGEVRLVPLSQAKDFKLQAGAPDIRKWNVFGSDGERLGVVNDMLVDPAGMRIRYIDVDLHDDLFALADDRHILVPLEHVDLKERGNDVWVRGLTAKEVAAFPAYPGGVVRPAMERALERAFETRVE